MTSTFPRSQGASLPAESGRQGAVIAALAATIATNALANSLPLNGRTTGAISDRFPLPIIPAGYTFSIWGLIYSGLVGYAVYQALPSQRGNPRLRRVAWPFIASCAANITWLLLWHYNHFGLTLGAMLGLLLALIVADTRLGHGSRPLAEWLLARLPFSIYLGWVSVATIINVTVALYDAGWTGTEQSRELWTAGLLAIGAALATALGLVRRDPAYPLTLAWAFAGIAAKNAGTPLAGPVAMVASGAAALAAAAAALRARRP